MASRLPGTNDLRIELNGEPREVAAETIAALLSELGVEPRHVAVERNRAIVPRSTFGEAALNNGDRLEIVHFVGGG